MNCLHFGFHRSKVWFIGAVLGISKKLRSKGRKPRPTHNQIWAKLQIWIHNCIQIYQVASFVYAKDLLEKCVVFFRNWGPKVKCQGHCMTKYGQKCSFGDVTHLLVPGSNLFNQKYLYGQCWAFLKILGPKVKGQDHYMTKCGQKFSWGHTFIPIYQIGTFINQKDLFEQC